MRFLLKFFIPIYLIYGFLLFVLCVKLSGNNYWIHDSISYLGTQKGSSLTFAWLLVSSGILLFLFEYNQHKFLINNLFNKNQTNFLFYTAIFCFFLSCLCLAIAGIVPFTVNYNIHLFCGWSIFIFYIWGILLTSINFLKRHKPFFLFSITIIFLCLIFSQVLIQKYISFSPVEILNLGLMLIWNLVLNLIIVRSKDFKKLRE